MLSLQRQSQRAGGAANVALNLARLRCPVTLTGLVGTDTAGACLVELLDEPGITQHFVRSPHLQTTQKIRLVSQRHQLLRMDVEVAPPAGCVDELATRVRELSSRHSWVLLSDYAKGALGDPQALIAHARGQGCKIVAVGGVGGGHDRGAGATRRVELHDPHPWRDHETLPATPLAHRDGRAVGRG